MTESADWPDERRASKPCDSQPSDPQPGGSQPGSSAPGGSAHEVTPPATTRDLLGQRLASRRHAAGDPTDATASTPVAPIATSTTEAESDSVSDKSPPTAPPTASAADSPLSRFTISSWEEMMSTKVFVALGGLALALAGALLFKHGYEHGWFQLSPMARIVLAAGAGAAMIALADRLRRGYGLIAQSLSGAGLCMLYATLAAATSLYDMLSPNQALLTLVALTAAAVGLSLRHGVYTAMLGLLGGFALPPLIVGGGDLGIQGMVMLLGLQVAGTWLAVRRGWSMPMWLGWAGTLTWAAMGLLGVVELGGSMSVTTLIVAGGFLPVVGVFAGGSAWEAAGNASVRDPDLGAGAEVDLFGFETRRAFDAALTQVAPIASVLLAGLHAMGQAYAPFELITLGAIGVAAIVLARLDSRFIMLAWAGAAMGGVVGFGHAWRAAENTGDPVTLSGFVPLVGI